MVCESPVSITGENRWEKNGQRRQSEGAVPFAVLTYMYFCNIIHMYIYIYYIHVYDYFMQFGVFKVFQCKEKVISRMPQAEKQTNQGRLQSSKGMVERGSYMVGKHGVLLVESVVCKACVSSWEELSVESSSKDCTKLKKNQRKPWSLCFGCEQRAALSLLRFEPGKGPLIRIVNWIVNSACQGCQEHVEHLVDLVARFAKLTGGRSQVAVSFFVFPADFCKIKDKGRDDILVSWSKARYLFQAKRGESLNKAGTNVSNKYRVATGKGEQNQATAAQNKMYRDARFWHSEFQSPKLWPPCPPIEYFCGIGTRLSLGPKHFLDFQTRSKQIRILLFGKEMLLDSRHPVGYWRGWERQIGFQNPSKQEKF